MNPNEVQYGGDHYKNAGSFQHWDMLPTCGFGWEYYTGCITGYMTRIKQPMLDAKKTQHFVDKLLWLIDNHMVPAVYSPAQSARVPVVQYMNEKFFPANGIDAGSDRAAIIMQAVLARTYADLTRLRSMMKSYVRNLEIGEADKKAGEPKWPFPEAGATPAYVNQDQQQCTTDNRVFVMDGSEENTEKSSSSAATDTPDACSSDGGGGSSSPTGGGD